MKNIKLIIVFVMGFILAIGISNAYILNANDVTYDKKNTTLESDNIQGAIDELAVLTNTLTDTSDATASETDILSGKTAYVNGEKITGTYEVKGDTQVYTGSKDWTGKTAGEESTTTAVVNIGANKTIIGVYFIGTSGPGFGSTAYVDAGSNNGGRFWLSHSYNSSSGDVTINFFFRIYTRHVTVTSISFPYVIVYY